MFNENPFNSVQYNSSGGQPVGVYPFPPATSAAWLRRTFDHTIADTQQYDTTNEYDTTTPYDSLEQGVSQWERADREDTP